jgi:hypothetical protein
MRSAFISLFSIVLLGACATEPGELEFGADGGMVDTADAAEAAPSFAEATDDEISSFCQKTLTQVTDLDWLGEQLGVQGSVLRTAWCHGLVAPNLAQVEIDRLAVCEQRITDCLRTSETVFSVQADALADCERILGEARTAACAQPVTDFRDCLAEAYPTGFSLGLTREQLQALADASCEELINTPLPRGADVTGPADRCVELENACDVFRF